MRDSCIDQAKLLVSHQQVIIVHQISLVDKLDHIFVFPTIFVNFLFDLEELIGFSTVTRLVRVVLIYSFENNHI